MSMKYRRLDTDYDYSFGNGLGDFLSDVEAVAQAIETRLKLWLEEWWMDLGDGLPMWQSILGYRGTNKEMVNRLITARIAGTTGVIAVKNITSSYDPSTRAYAFQAYVDTEYGVVVVSNVPFAPGVGG